MDKNSWIWGAIGGAISALLVIGGLTNPAPSTSLTFFSLCHIPLFMASLALGINAAVFGALTGLLLMIALSQPGAGVFFVFLVIVPSVLLAYFGLLSRNARNKVEWFPVGEILVWLVGAAFAVYATVFLTMKAPDNQWTVQMRQELTASVNEMNAQLPPESQMSVDLVEQSVVPLIPFIPGILVSLCLLIVVVNAIIAQGLLTAMKKNHRPTPKMSELYLPQWTPMLVAVLGLLAAFGPARWHILSLNLLLICVVPLLLAGLAVIHARLENSPSRALGLVVTYALLFFSPLVLFIPILIVVAIGLAEQWIQLRHRQDIGQ